MKTITYLLIGLILVGCVSAEIGVDWRFYNFRLLINNTGAYGLNISNASQILWKIGTTDGTITNIATGTGLTGGPITTTGTISVASGLITNASNGQTAYTWGNHATAGYSNLTIAQVSMSVGNWSGNASNYATTATLNTLGNWSANQSNYIPTTAAATCTEGNYSSWNGTNFTCNPTNEGATGNPFDQDLNTTNDPVFAGLTIQNNGNEAGIVDHRIYVETNGEDSSIIIGNNDTHYSYIDVYNALGDWYFSIQPNGSFDMSNVYGTTVPIYSVDTNNQLDIKRNLTIDGELVCTAANGLCAGVVPYQSNAGGWTNTSTTTSTSLAANISGVIYNSTGMYLNSVKLNRGAYTLVCKGENTTADTNNAVDCDYNCPTGSTCDAQVQNAANKGGLVIFRDTNYTITSNIKIGSNTQFLGTGNTTINIIGNSTFYLQDQGYYQNIGFSNLIFNGDFNTTNNVMFNFSGIQNLTGIEFNNLEFTNYKGQAIMLQLTPNSLGQITNVKLDKITLIDVAGLLIINELSTERVNKINNLDVSNIYHVDGTQFTPLQSTIGYGVFAIGANNVNIKNIYATKASDGPEVVLRRVQGGTVNNIHTYNQHDYALEISDGSKDIDASGIYVDTPLHWGVFLVHNVNYQNAITENIRVSGMYGVGLTTPGTEMPILLQNSINTSVIRNIELNHIFLNNTASYAGISIEPDSGLIEDISFNHVLINQSNNAGIGIFSGQGIVNKTYFYDVKIIDPGLSPVDADKRTGVLITYANSTNAVFDRLDVINTTNNTAYAIRALQSAGALQFTVKDYYNSTGLPISTYGNALYSTISTDYSGTRIVGDLMFNGSTVCTAGNGLCGVNNQSNSGGWINDTTTRNTTGNLNIKGVVNINGSASNPILTFEGTSNPYIAFNVAGSLKNLISSTTSVNGNFLGAAVGDFAIRSQAGKVLLGQTTGSDSPALSAGLNIVTINSSMWLVSRNTVPGTLGLGQMFFYTNTSRLGIYNGSAWNYGDLSNFAQTINVNGTIYQNSVAVCLANGTNCPAETFTGVSNLTIAQVAASIGNWSENASSYATQAYAQALGNWSSNQSNYATFAATVASLGNWSGNQSSYATTALLSTIGNWSGNSSSYDTSAGVTAKITNSTIVRNNSGTYAINITGFVNVPATGRYIYYYNTTYWGCINTTGYTIYNSGNASVSCA